MGSSDIHIRGARQHNLQEIELSIPRERLVVLTGPSGSGKTSLAFDTIYAEGQRRYVESLSTYARRFLERLPKPDVDLIEGLSPAIAIQQQSAGRNPRSTVGTVTEIHDYLRLLFSRVGHPHCPSCGRRVTAHTVQQIVDAVLAEGHGQRFAVLAPLRSEQRGDLSDELQNLRKQGFVRIRLDGEQRDLGDEIAVDANEEHRLEVYIDRLSVKRESRQRLTEAIELATSLADGRVVIAWREGPDWPFSERFACESCGITLPEFTPQTFSFNNPAGACPRCGGLGEVWRFEPARVIPDGTLSIADGAIVPWGKAGGAYHRRMMGELTERLDVDVHTPWQELAERTRKRVLWGDERKGARSKQGQAARERYEGCIPALQRRMREYEKRKREQGAGEEQTLEYLEQELGQYTTRGRCPDCQGTRLRPEARAVTVAGQGIHALSTMSLENLASFLDDPQLPETEHAVAARVLREVRSRVGFLLDVGLDYLSLDRAASTLSGGEAERIRLATQIGAGLVGVLYVLDEPSVGLHPRDNARLVGTLERLRDGGSTVLVVEHERATIESADYVVDMGPGAGTMGGEVVATGTPAELREHPGSATGAFLSGRREIEVPARRRAAKRTLKVKGAATHNLKNLDVTFPLGVLTCVTGVSGSGKSSLVLDTVLPVLRGEGSHGEHSAVARLQGAEHIEKVVSVDQSPIGRTPRSNPASYTGLLSQLRELFASLPEARARGYKSGRFSFNVKGGRCEACQGEGLVRIEMHFLPDVYVECEHCGGRRYNRETLEILYRGYNIADVLDMSVDDALVFFETVPKVRQRLQALKSVGLGYVELGRPATTLSGGEAQRIRLARELARRTPGHTLYVLDEPTTGLHFVDVEVLLDVLRKLVEQGHSVWVIEHDLDVIKMADHVIDLGPEGGERGGELVAAGTPEQVASVSRSHTGRYLKQMLRASDEAHP